MRVGGENRTASPAFRVRWHRPQHGRTLFLSLQGLFLEPEFAFRVSWNPWINSSTPQILFALNTRHNNFKVFRNLEGKDSLTLFSLRQRLGPLEPVGPSVLLKLGFWFLGKVSLLN